MTEEIALKYDDGKPPLDLIPAFVLRLYSTAYSELWPQTLDNAWWDAREGLQAMLDYTIDDLIVAMGAFGGNGLEYIAQVLAFGAQKYDSWNWIKGFEWSRLWAAARRHIVLGQYNWHGGEIGTLELDEESQLPHLAHAAVMLIFLREHVRHGLGTDDRPCRRDA